MSKHELFNISQVCESLIGEFPELTVSKINITYKPYSVRRFISICIEYLNAIQLFYSNGKEIYSKEISYSGEILSDISEYLVKTSLDGDELKYASARSSDVSHWYENVYVSLSQQKIKNQENKKVKRKRWVYNLGKFNFQ